MPQREQAGCAHNSSVVAMTWWRKVHRMQLCSYPLESRRVPPAVVVKTHVSVDLDDQQRLGGRVVDQVSGGLAEPGGRDLCGPGMRVLGRPQQGAEVAAGRQCQRPGSTGHPQPRSRGRAVTLCRACSNPNSGVCTPTTVSPASAYFAAQARR